MAATLPTTSRSTVEAVKGKLDAVLRGLPERLARGALRVVEQSGGFPDQGKLVFEAGMEGAQRGTFSLVTEWKRKGACNWKWTRTLQLRLGSQVIPITIKVREALAGWSQYSITITWKMNGYRQALKAAIERKTRKAKKRAARDVRDMQSRGMGWLLELEQREAAAPSAQRKAQKRLRERRARLETAKAQTSLADGGVRQLISVSIIEPWLASLSRR
jgi:hypothetical protein